MDSKTGGASSRGRRGNSDAFMPFHTILENDSILGSSKGSSYTHKPTLLGDDDLALVKSQRENGADPVMTPMTELRLSALRFAVVVLIGVSIVVAVMLVFLHGVTIKRGITDPIGSSKNADDEVEFFQTISGFLTAMFGMCVDKYFAIFLAVMLTYFGNVKLYPSDRPQLGQTKFKRAVLFCFVPLINYLVNIAVSSLNVQHTTIDIQRVFVKEDLVATALAQAHATLLEGESVENTILKSAVRKHSVPFEILADSPCKLENTTDADIDDFEPSTLPTVKEIRSTAVVFGFPVQNWNRAVFPTAAAPTHAVTFQVHQLDNADRAGVEREFAAFQASTGFDFLTGYEMLLQGKTLFERSVSDGNSTATYPCTLVDGRSQDDRVPAPRRRLAQNSSSAASANGTTSLNGTARASGSAGSVSDDFEDIGEDDGWVSDFPFFESGEHKGKRMCSGAVSSLPDLANITDKATHTLRAFTKTLARGMNKTLKQIAADEITITLESYALTSQMKLTAMNIDIPYAASARYRDVSESCTAGGKLKESTIKHLSGGNGTLSRDELEAYELVLCDQSVYPFDPPNSLCGSSNCVFLDKSELGVHLRKQLLLLPYLQGCDVQHMHYDNDFLNFLPSHCQPKADAVFLYGLGAYMNGDLFSFADVADHHSSNASDSVRAEPFLLNPRRHISLSFAKLEWTHRDLSKVFRAKCGSSEPDGCDGLVLPLANVTAPTSRDAKVLLLGKAHLPEEVSRRTFRNPVQLVSLNTRPFFYEHYNKYFEWEYLDRKKRFADDAAAAAKDAASHGHASAATKAINTTLSGARCSLLIDSYIKQLEANHYFIEEPLQPLYTSALYYLFQDAAVKAVRAPFGKTAADVMAALALKDAGVRFKGDRERKQIKFSIPAVSAISTFVGIAVLVLYATAVVYLPRDRLRKTDETNAAARYADVLTDDVYPAEVHTRSLAYPPAVAEQTGRGPVNMDEYVVDSITFHHQRDPDRKVYL